MIQLQLFDSPSTGGGLVCPRCGWKFLTDTWGLTLPPVWLSTKCNECGWETKKSVESGNK